MSNGSNNQNTIYILYKIVNSDSDNKDPCYNAFPMNLGSGNGRGPTLASVKQQCAAVYGLNNLGPEGYHWRVFVEDKHPIPGGGVDGSGASGSFSWWDIQDENASLPIKEARQSQLNKFFGPSSSSFESISGDGDDYSTKTAKGALKTLGKAMSHVTGAAGVGDDSSGPTVKVVAFKLLDLVKMQDDYTAKHGSNKQQMQQHLQQHTRTTTARHSKQVGSNSSGYSAPAHRPAPTQQQQQQAARTQQQQHRSTAASTAPNRVTQIQQQQRTAPTAHRPAQQQQQQQQEASLMDFGPPSAPVSSHPVMALSSSKGPPPNETRAQRLKREYAEKNAQSNRVWDEIDERWVEVEPKKTAAVIGAGAPAGSVRSMNSLSSGMGNISFGADSQGSSKKKEIGIKLDPANAAGKSATVQAAVHARVNEMRQSQAKALQEVREREMKKKKEEMEEDQIRKVLEPKIKFWSEEHGKKKQLRALLASLHTILWPDAQWKQVTIGDLLDPKKVKLQFHKASRVVHPDKTHHLPPEQRFLAKRIFDALSQAKNEFDESGGK